MTRWRPRLSDERGSVLLGGIVLVLILTMVGLAIFDLAVVESNLAETQGNDSQALRVAEAAVFKALRELSDGNGTNDFCATYNPCTGGVVNQASATYPIFLANSLFPDSGRGNSTGAYTVTTRGFPAASPPSVQITAAGCFPTPNYGAPNCPTTGSAPAGVSRKIITASITYSTGGFLGGFWGDAWIDFSGPGANLADSFDSRTAGYSSTRPCSSNPPPCWGTKADLFVRAGTGSCTSNCGPTPDSGCWQTGKCSQQPSGNIKSCNCALYMGADDAINGNVTTAPNKNTSNVYETSSVDDLSGKIGGGGNICSTPSTCTYSNINYYDSSQGKSVNSKVAPGPNGSANPLTGAYVTTDCSASGGYTGGGTGAVLPITPSTSYTYSKGDVTFTGPATFNNNAGTICIHGVAFSGGSASISVPSTATAPVIVRMEHHFTMSTQNQVKNLTHQPDMFQIVDSYGGGAAGQTLYGGNDMYLVVNTPGVNVVLMGGDYYGAMIGRSINTSGSTSAVKLHVDEALPFSAKIFQGTPAFRIASWTVQ